MDADAHREPHAVGLCQAGVQRPQGVEHANAGVHGPLGVVFVGLRIAKVHQQAIAQILGDIPIKALQHFNTGRLIGQHDLAQVFRVELTGEAGGVGQVTEQHRELAALGLRRTRGSKGRRTLGQAVCLADGLRRVLED
jgi:hypothetical protein